MDEPRPWNLNIHYHQVFLGAVPDGARTALDVGCGDGVLTFDLADAGLDVVGIDPHAPSIGRARSSARVTDHTHFVCGDVFGPQLDPSSFDVVTANAMLHHVDTADGLRRLRELVKPGGVVAVVCFAMPDSVGDHLRSVAGMAMKRVRVVRGQYWEHNAPMKWPPPLTSTELIELAEAELPGVRSKRLMSNRVSLAWRAPVGER